MCWIHEALGYSDAISVRRDQRGRDSVLFNVVLALVFWLTQAAYFGHAAYLYVRGKQWLMLKIALFLLLWSALSWYGFLFRGR
jgi:putative Ca2+/H+ antiporter (TMEM165/GDT1 family)